MLGTFPKAFPKRQLPKGIFPSGNFPRVFSQAATSQGYFPKRQLPKGIFPIVQLPKSVLVAALGPLAHPSHSALIKN